MADTDKKGHIPYEKSVRYFVWYVVLFFILYN